MICLNEAVSEPIIVNVYRPQLEVLTLKGLTLFRLQNVVFQTAVAHFYTVVALSHCHAAVAIAHFYTSNLFIEINIFTLIYAVVTCGGHNDKDNPMLPVSK
jgi:hypothetical protein